MPLNRISNSSRAIIFVLSLFINKEAFAWAPCLPFCDGSCGAPAIAAFGASVQAATAQQQSQFQTLGREINSSSKEITNFSKNYIDAISNDAFDRMSALDASTSKREASWAQLLKAKENLTDFKLRQWNATISGYFQATQAADSEKTFGQASQSETGQLGACAAGEIKRAMLSNKQVSEEIIEVQKRYLHDLKDGDSALAIAVKSTDEFSNSNVLSLLHDASIPDAQLSKLQGILNYIVMPNPPVESDSVTAIGDEKLLKVRLQNSTAAWIAGITAEVLARRAVYGELQCEDSYVVKSSQAAGSSMNELMKSKIEGRLVSDGYWGAAKLLLPTGLKREIVYLKAEENMLLYQRYQIRERRNQLLALIAAMRIKEREN